MRGKSWYTWEQLELYLAGEWHFTTVMQIRKSKRKSVKFIKQPTYCCILTSFFLCKKN